MLNVAFMTERARDVPGIFVSHCLTLDLVSQGTCFASALTALCEAIRICAEDDSEHGLTPSDRKPAPAADWERFERTMERSLLVYGPRGRDDRIEAEVGWITLTTDTMPCLISVPLKLLRIREQG